jgi:hypothetical protein
MAQSVDCILLERVEAGRKIIERRDAKKSLDKPRELRSCALAKPSDMRFICQANRECADEKEKLDTVLSGCSDFAGQAGDMS